MLLQALNDEPSFLFFAVKEGHVELVRALLEVGGRELAMMTRDNGVSCLMINAANRHLDVVNALLEVGGRELVMLTADNGISCLMMSAENGHVDVVNALLEAGEREHAMLTADNGASCLFSAASDQCGEWACGCGERAAGSRGFQRPPGSRPSSALGPSIVSLNTNKSSLGICNYGDHIDSKKRKRETITFTVKSDQINDSILVTNQSKFLQ